MGRNFGFQKRPPAAPHRTDIRLSEWVQNPDAKVKRFELMAILSHYDRQRRATAWYRRLWRWLVGGKQAVGPAVPPVVQPPPKEDL